MEGGEAIKPAGEFMADAMSMLLMFWVLLVAFAPILQKASWGETWKNEVMQVSITYILT